MEEQHKKQEVADTRWHNPQPQSQQPPQHQPPYISQMEPVTHGAYGGGMYGTDDDREKDNNVNDKKPGKPPASETQSADGPDAAKAVAPKHKPPPSSGDRDIDITGQSYIQ